MHEPSGPELVQAIRPSAEPTSRRRVESRTASRIASPAGDGRRAHAGRPIGDRGRHRADRGRPGEPSRSGHRSRGRRERRAEPDRAEPAVGEPDRPPLDLDAVRQVWPDLVKKVGAKLGMRLVSRRADRRRGPDVLVIAAKPGYNSLADRVRDCRGPGEDRAVPAAAAPPAGDGPLSSGQPDRSRRVARPSARRAAPAETRWRPTRWSRRSSSCSRRVRSTWSTTTTRSRLEPDPARLDRRPQRSGLARVGASARSSEPHHALEAKKATVFNQLGKLADLMRNAGKLRESVAKATESLGQLQVEGTSGGGAVTAKVNGRLEVVSVRIDPKLLADGDAELLEDLVTAAVNAGLAKAREAAAQSLASLTGGLPPGCSRLGGADPGPTGGEAVTMSGFSAAVDRLTIGPGPLARDRRQVRRAAGPSPPQVPGRGGPRAGRGHPRGQGPDPPLPGLLPPDRGRPADLRDLPRPAPRPGDRLRRRAIARPAWPWRRPGPSRASTTSSWAASPRSQGMGPEQLTVDALDARVQSGTVRELIMATNPNLEGDGTALSSPTACTTAPSGSPGWPAAWPPAAPSSSPTATCSPTPSPADSRSDPTSLSVSCTDRTVRDDPRFLGGPIARLCLMSRRIVA